jgi:hypothetical protein
MVKSSDNICHAGSNGGAGMNRFGEIMLSGPS